METKKLLEKLGQGFQTCAHAAIDIREKSKATKGWAENDARLTIFNKISNVLYSVSLGYFLMHEYVGDSDWWTRTEKFGADRNSIVIAASEFEMFFRIGLVQNLSYAIESSFRIYVRAVDANACKSGKAEFKSIYEWLLKRLDLQTQSSLLDLWRNIRNVMHNNGFFYPPKGKDQRVTVNGTTYDFTVGDHIDFITTEFISSLIPDLLELVRNVTLSSPLSEINRIEEIS